MRKGRRVIQKTISISLLFLCVTLFLYTTPNVSSSIKNLFPTNQQASKQTIAAVAETPNVIEKTVQESATTSTSGELVAVGKDFVTQEVLAAKSDWIPGAQYLKVGHYVNGSLQEKASPTVKIIDIEEQKLEFGLNFLGNESTRKKIPDPNNPKLSKFVGLCGKKTGTMIGIASINFSAIPIPKFLSQGLQLSTRQVSEGVYAKVDKAFLDGLTPMQYENFCSYIQKTGKYYQEFATASIFGNQPSANSMGNGFVPAIGNICANRAPGDKLSATEFAQPWLAVEQGLKTITYRMGVNNNLKDNKEGEQKMPAEVKRLMISKGLGGLRWMGEGDTLAYMWQPKQAPNQVKNAAVSVATVTRYDYSAAPGKDSKSLKTSYGVNDLVSTAQAVQSESARETILSALVGGMYYLPIEAIDSGNNNSMLYFDPIKADPKQSLCDPKAWGNANKCIIVNVQSKCSAGGLGVTGDVNVPYVTLSTVDTQTWAANTEEGSTRSFNRGAGMTTDQTVKAPNLIDQATTEQVAMYGNTAKLTNRCKAAIEPVVDAQGIAGKGVFSERGIASLTALLTEHVGYKMQPFLALPVQISGNVFLPYVNALTGKYEVKKTNLKGKEYIPAIYELKFNGLWDGTEGLAVGDLNSVDAEKLIKDALKREGVLEMTNGKIDCLPATPTTVTMWPCQDDGYLLAKCQ